MVWGAIAGAAISAYGANRAAKSQAAAADRQIAMQREMQQQAAEAAKFRPVGVTSPYGRSNITVSPEGQLESVGFNLSPEFQRRATMFADLGETTLAGLTGDPMEAARMRTERLEALNAPGRALAQERLFSDLASKGLTGLAVDTGMGGQSNPYMMALAQAEEQQRARTAAESYDLARGQMGEDFRLAQMYFGGQQGLFDLGQQELGQALDIADIERQRAIAAATGQANFGTNISNIMGAQAQTAAQQQAALYGGIGNAVGGMNLSGLFSGGGGGTSTMLQNPTLGPGVGAFGGNAAGGYARGGW